MVVDITPGYRSASHLTIGGHTHANSTAHPIETYDAGHYGVKEIRITVMMPQFIQFTIIDDDGDKEEAAYSGDFHVLWLPYKAAADTPE